MARRRRIANKENSNDVARTRTGRTRSSPSNQRFRRDKVAEEGSRGSRGRQQSITREMVINRRVRNSSSRRGWRGENYCIAGIVLSIAVNLLVNGPQSVSAGFACLSNPCVFGVCVDDLNSTYSCYCIDGYTGSQCQTNWDECWSSPCQNGAVCIDGVAHYNCSCPEGFAGVNCEENLDECASNPCQNGGLCNDRDNSYSCSCPPGYLGTHCETDVTVCESAGATGERCQNGGSCVEGPGLEFTCQCPSGWQGQRCEVERNECESSPCENGAVCVDKLDSYLCACPMKFTGTNCEEPVLECDDSPCHNEALCLMEEGLPVCYCVPDFHGENCADQYDECQLGPRCLNGGTCIDGVDDFTCSCPAGLTGLLCECLILDSDEANEEGESPPNLNCNYTRNDSDTEMFSTVVTDWPITPIEGNYQTTTPGMHQPGLTTDNGEAAAEEVTTTPGGAAAAAGDTITTIRSGLSTTNNAYTTTTDAVVGEETTTTTPAEGQTTTSYNFPVTPITITTSDLDARTTPPSSDDNDLASMTTTSTSVGGLELSSTSVVGGDYGAESDKFTTILLPGAETTTSRTDSMTTAKDASAVTEEGESGAITTTTMQTATEAGETKGPTSEVSIATASATSPAVQQPTTTTIIITKATTRPDWEPPRGTTVDETVTVTQTGFPHPEFFTDSPQTSSTGDATTETTTQATFEPKTTTTTKPFDGTITNFTLGLDCKRMPCLNGGTCIMTSGGAKCLCSYNRKGMFCEKTLQIRRAAFAGDSYVSHRVNGKHRQWGDEREEEEDKEETTRTMTDGYKDELERALPIDVVFRGRTRAAEGLIMLAVGQGTHGSHYMALFLQRGLLQFQFSCGLQTMLLSELEAPINTGHEMIIHASLDFSRNFSHCNASLKVNDSLALSGDQSTWLGQVLRRKESQNSEDGRPIILNTWLHLGGAPQAPIGLISELPGAATGFTGCLHSLRINGRKRDLFGDAADGYGVTECGSLACLSNPCRNGARCVEVQPNNNAEEDYDNTIGLSSSSTLNRRGRQRRMSHDNPGKTSRWAAAAAAAESPMASLSSLRKKEEDDERRLHGIIPGQSSSSDMQSDYRAAAEEDEGDYFELEDNRNWQCKCPTGYIGPTCEISVCDNNPCQYGGTCVPYPGSGYLCLCPFGKHGHYCEHNLEITQPTFSGSVYGMSSYVSYPVTIPLDYEMELSFRIAPSTLNQIALLAFVGQTGYHDDRADHLAVSFVKGYVMLTWNVGGGPRRIFTPKPVQDNNNVVNNKNARNGETEGGAEHVIHVRRVGRQAWLSVDNRVNVTGRAPGSQSKMEVAPVLYLGGHDVANFSTLPHDLPLHSGFEGCIYDLQLRTGHVNVPITASKGVHGRGVGQCNTKECHRHACQHDGACLQHGATFTCICQEGWFGPLCAHSSNPCDAENNRCHSASTCVPLVTSYECDCPTGRTGKNCDTDINSLSDVSLTGRRSYLAIDWPAVAWQSSKDGSQMTSRTRTERIFENEIPSDKYRMQTQSASSTAAHGNSGHIELKFVNELGQPVVRGPVKYYGQQEQGQQMKRKANYESVSDNQRQQFLLPVESNSGGGGVGIMGPTTTTTIHQRLQFYSIEFQLRPLSERGLLVFFGAFGNELDDAVGFVSLSLQGGVVEFRIASRKDHVTVLRSNRILAIGEWHKVRFSQSGRRLSLWVEGSAVATTTEYNGLYIRRGSRIYFGGLPDLAKLPLNSISGFPVPYRGCVRQVVVSGFRVVLNETNIKESRNIQDCDGTSCGGDMCDLGGHCWLDNRMQPHCKCPESTSGERCEVQASCFVVQCKNGGRCLKNGQCNCPNGYGGYYCEIAMSILATPSFNGRSYLKVVPGKRSITGGSSTGAAALKEKRHGSSSRAMSDNLIVSMNFSTTDVNGLLLWSSAEEVKGAKEFLGLGLENGHLKLASSLLETNDSTVDIPTGGYLADGGWHNLYLFRSERQFEVRIDDREIFSEDNQMKGKFQKDISMQNEFFIGGFPDDQLIAEVTADRFHHPFRGCLQDVFVNSDVMVRSGDHLDFSKLQGQNIGICDLEDNFV